MLRDATTNTRALKLQEHLERVSTVLVDAMGRGQQAVAAAGIDSCTKQQWHCCRAASQAPPAHSVQQAAWSRPSACQASTHAPQILASAVRQQQHACTSTAAVVAHGASCARAVHPRGQPSIPRPRGTSGAIAQQPVGLLLPDKDSSMTHHQGSNASAVSVSVATILT